MSSSTVKNVPTPRQLRCLRDLAQQTATSFSYPKTGWQASREINRLLALKASGQCPSPLELERHEHEMHYATAVKADEVVGFGSSASWRTSGPTDAIVAQPQVGIRTELARYSVEGSERVIYGQRIDGSVRLTDRPACSPGRSYLIARAVEQDGYDAMMTLVSEYISQAHELHAIPMASSKLRRQQELTDAQV